MKQIISTRRYYKRSFNTFKILGCIIILIAIVSDMIIQYPENDIHVVAIAGISIGILTVLFPYLLGHRAIVDVRINDNLAESYSIYTQEAVHGGYVRRGVL